MDDRIKHIDIARGISISLVAIFHADLRHFYPDIIEPTALFRMPLFFLLSGIFFSWSASPKDFLIKKSEALLKPYFSVLFLVLFLDFISGENNLSWKLKGLLYGNGNTISWMWMPSWFLTHLFILYCFSYILFRVFRLSDFSSIALCITLALFMLVGSVWLDYFWYREIHAFHLTTKLPGLPFSFDIILITCTYFIVGQRLKFTLTNFRPSLWYLIFSLFAFSIVSQFTDAHMDLNMRVYDDPVYTTLGAISGIYIIIYFSYFISKSYRLSIIPLSLGKASLYILMFHFIIGKHSFAFLSSGVDNEKILIYLSFISFFLSIFIPLIIKNIVEKNSFLSLFFLPFKSNKLVRKVSNS